MSETSGLLEHTDRFLRAKRNLLFWAGATVLVECTHTNAAISPQVFGAALSINPRVLTTLMLMVTSYHALAFYYEQSIVRVRNSVLARGRNISSPEALITGRLNDIQSIMQPQKEALNKLNGALGSLKRDVPTLRASDEALINDGRKLIVTLQPLAALNLSSLDLNQQDARLSLRNVISQAQSSFQIWRDIQSRWEVHLVQAEPVYESIAKMDILQATQGELDRLLQTNIEQLTKLHDSVSVGEQNMFRWYDTIAPSLLLILAWAIWLYDLSPLPSPSVLLSR